MVNKMKIAVSTDDYITVSGHVGRCKGFMIFEIENGEILKVQKRDNNFSNRVSKKDVLRST
jgi:predicted Fe-Mo cluster-binding NifX family protein